MKKKIQSLINNVILKIMSTSKLKIYLHLQVIEDIRLVFDNCWLYNRTDAEEYQCGLRLEKYFLKEGKKLGLLGGHEKSNAPPLHGKSHDTDDDEEVSEPPPKRGRRTY